MAELPHILIFISKNTDNENTHYQNNTSFLIFSIAFEHDLQKYKVFVQKQKRNSFFCTFATDRISSEFCIYDLYSPMKKVIFISLAAMALLLFSCRNTQTNRTYVSNASKSTITAEMAYEGVNNYCHREYDWSIAKENPSMMYVEMGEETDSAYQVVFRSYTGALVYFYVDKTSGSTRMVEQVPSLGVEEEVGRFELSDYTE